MISKQNFLLHSTLRNPHIHIHTYLMVLPSIICSANRQSNCSAIITNTYSKFTKILKLQGRINNLILSSKLAVHFAPFGVLKQPKKRFLLHVLLDMPSDTNTRYVTQIPMAGSFSAQSSSVNLRNSSRFLVG